MNTSVFSSLLRRWALVPALLLAFAWGSAIAQTDADPPGRVAHLSARQGSLVYAPDGEDEWTDLPINRPLTRGDRLWTDRGARAELHLGTSAVHIDGESNLAFYELDDDEAQLSLTQGTVNARVRELAPRENFEVDTPNLALRALQPGDYRVDVDPASGTTRVVVRSGEAVVYGERGESMRLGAGQQAVFTGRSLQRVGGGIAGFDDFDRWASERNRAEDQSVSARYVPRSVIGYSQLDSYGTWGQEADYGAVWYPRVTVQDWAPYRYGRWTYVRPWGWTWVDDAPWGFAPFHYGRWAFIHNRWAWVPGRIGPRPVYSPALVVFVGGGGVNFSISIGSNPGIAWYPLGPGEAWYPPYRYSPRYLSGVNRNITIINQVNHIHIHRDRWATAVRVDDFHRGRPVRDAWRPVRSEEIRRAPVVRELPRPERDRNEERRERAPRLQAAPPAPATQAPARVVREPVENRDADRAQREAQRQQRDQERDRERAEREQERAQREAERQQRDQAVRQQQERTQRDQERAAREQERAQREAERQQRDQAVRQQQERAQREQERAAREQERTQREAERQQRDQAVRQQQERAQREQERAAREQERAQREAERQQRDQAVRQQQERAQREQERAAREQERAQREQAREQQQNQRERPAPQTRQERDGRDSRSKEQREREQREDDRRRNPNGG
jgi:DNA segregation ATPase FtsK/SpoIIIE-like protein